MVGENRTLEQRIRAIEDRLEIYNLIAGHPPSADTGADYYAEAVYTEDGVFDRGPDLSGATGNKAIAASLKSPGHQAAIAGGLAHFTGLPHIALDGDKAVVTSYLQILAPHKSGESDRSAQSRQFARLSHPPGGDQPLGARPHRHRLENQAAHHPPGRRLGAVAGHFARGAEGV